MSSRVSSSSELARSPKSKIAFRVRFLIVFRSLYRSCLVNLLCFFFSSAFKNRRCFSVKMPGSRDVMSQCLPRNVQVITDGTSGQTCQPKRRSPAAGKREISSAQRRATSPMMSSCGSTSTTAQQAQHRIMTLTTEESDGIRTEPDQGAVRTSKASDDTDERDGDRGVTRLFGPGALAVFGARRALRPRE